MGHAPQSLTTNPNIASLPTYRRRHHLIDTRQNTHTRKTTFSTLVYTITGTENTLIVADRRRPPQVPEGWRAVWNDIHQRYFFVSNIAGRKPTWTNPMLEEQRRRARQPFCRDHSSAQIINISTPAFSEHVTSRIEELPSSNASEEEAESLRFRSSSSSKSISSERPEPDALELSPGFVSASEKVLRSHVAMDGNEEQVILPLRERIYDSSESAKQNLSLTSLSSHSEMVSAQDTVIEDFPPGPKPGPPSASSHQSEQSKPDLEDRSSVRGPASGTYDWRSEPPLKKRPDSIYEAYECQPLRPEDNYMMSGGLGPGSPVRSPAPYTEERGRSRLSPHEEGIATQFPSLEHIVAKDPPLEGLNSISREGSTHKSVTEPEKPVHGQRKSRGRSLSKKMLPTSWMDIYHSFVHSDQGKYPMAHHRSMKYLKKTKVQHRALQDIKASKKAWPEPFPPVQGKSHGREPLHYKPLQSEPLQSKPRASWIRSRIAQSHSPPTLRSHAPRTRVAQSHSPPSFGPDARRASTNYPRRPPYSPPRPGRTSNARSTRSEEPLDSGFRPPWMPDMTDFERSEGSRYYRFDPDVAAERERAARYRRLEVDAMDFWRVNFGGKPYKKSSLPVDPGWSGVGY